MPSAAEQRASRRLYALGLALLVVGYVLSQFYRAFLAVLAPVLLQDIGADAHALSQSSGLWFLTFAAMQIPVGWALDRIGPRLTAAVLFGVCAGGGAAIFAMAQTPAHINVAMALIGIGCSPVLMASYYILARVFPPALFATLAGAVLGIGTLGNLASSLPLAWAVETFGWRQTVWAVVAITLAVALMLATTIKNPPSAHDGEGSSAHGSLFDLLKIRALWLILPMMLVNYAPAAGLRGLWAGPYMADVYGFDAGGIGRVTLFMGMAMIAGNFAYGPMDRLFGTRKWVVLGGNLLVALALFLLWMNPAGGTLRSTVLLAAIGFFGASFPLLMAHGSAFFPPHLVGRGVTLLNLFGIGGVGIMQFASGPWHQHLLSALPTTAAAYGGLFLAFGIAVLAGCALYAFCRDRP